MKTMEQYKAEGGFVAFVPGDITTVITADKTMRGTTPDGRAITRTGPEVLQTEIVEGRRVVRFSHIDDFRRIKGGNRGLDWERLNPDLCLQLAKMSISNQGPGAIRG